MSDTYTDRPEAYLAGDRRRAISERRTLSDRVHGAGLFADVSGFTPLTEALANELGPQRGAEELTAHLNRVFHAVIDDVDRFGGDVIYFGGDAITCWFDGDDGRLGAACGRAIQRTMTSVGNIRTPGGTEVVLAIKVAVAVGSARRFVVGDPTIQLIDVLAGRLIDELADAEHLAEKGDVVLARSALESLGEHAAIDERRHDEQHGVVGVLAGLGIEVDEVARVPSATELGEELVRPWILPAVYERLVSGRGEFLAELRSACPVFVRFGGIDYDNDPDAAEKLDDFVQRAQRILAGYGGNLLHVILGDKGAYLCCVFGTPHAHEDDASRAARAALELLELEHVTAATNLQIGITQGRVRSGAYGHPMRRTFTCLGDAVNLSARLMSHAPPGQVYISEDAHRALSERLECHVVGDLTIKGKVDPVRVLRVVGLRRGPARRELRYPLPMVGRDSEMAVFATAFDDVRAGSGRVVGLAAEAGRGKSRLIAEVVRGLAGAGVTIAWGEAQNFGRTTSYLVWRDVWRTLLSVDDDADQGTQQTELTRRLSAISTDLARRGPLLAAVLGIDIDDNELTRRFDAKLRKASLESLLVDLLRDRAAHEPIAIVLEDCHWIDPLSRDVLEELVVASSALPVLFILAYRPAAAPGGGLGLERIPYYQELNLGELGASDAHLVLRAKLDQLFGESVEAAPEIIEFVIERAQGNPFYLEELINYLHALGIDPAEPTAFRGLYIPDTLVRLVQSRLDLLAEGPRTALKVASIVGRTFDTPFVQGVYPQLGSLDDVDAKFETAREADLIRIDRVEDRSWLFRHVVARDVAYDSQPFAMRAILHDKVGAYLESGGPQAIERNLDLLAHHYWLGENEAKKREYAVRAGIAAQARYANDAAADYFQRALPLVPENERTGVLRRLGKVLELRGGWVDAEATYRQAVELSLQLGDAPEQARAHADLAESLRKQGRFEDARQQLVAAGAIFSRLDDDAGLGLVLHLEGTLASQQAQYDLARAAYEQSLQIRERLGDQASIGSLLSNLALVAENEGDLERARSMNERALAIRQEVGDSWAICVSQNNLGMIALLQHDFGAAQMRFEESMRLAAEVGDRWIVAVGHHNLGNATLGLGEPAVAGSEFLQALHAYEDYGDLWSIALLVEDMVLLAVANDQLVQAAEMVGAADVLREHLDAPRPPSAAATLDEALEPVRLRLGDTELLARDRGRNLDPAALATLVREVGRPPNSGPPPVDK
jgi:class 3 adenylate cyclase/tetratricopeptide (TPR) repeat protein